MVKHFLTIDVESSARAAGSQGQPDPGLASAMMELLQFLDEHRIRATLFVLTRDLPGLESCLQQAVKNGHEIGSHGVNHRRIDCLEPSVFRKELRESKQILEDVAQKPCVSFRAPWFSAPPPDKAAWFFEALTQEGFQIDASFKLLAGRMHLVEAAASGIREVPVPLVRVAGVKTGVLGGLALRVLPCFFIKNLFDKIANHQSKACVYLHPYEWHAFDVVRSSSIRSRIRRRLALNQTFAKLSWLAKKYSLTSLEHDRI